MLPACVFIMLGTSHHLLMTLFLMRLGATPLYTPDVSRVQRQETQSGE